ncbi:hypothetical protein LJC40_01910 [Synergistaceae bacterium OttesenSCG-928-D05]|nr:hypothetical protein [Synergistaceae bacterium OttesenSCG-928-D05]
MNSSIAVFFKYFFAWTAMSGVLIALLFMAEGAYGFVADRIYERSNRGESSTGIKTLLQAFRMPILVPDTAARQPAVYFPALAIAALLPIPACIPFFNFIPLMVNSGDLLQIVQFALMSETFALLSIFSLGTNQSRKAGMELFFESVGLLLAFAACFISISFYLTANGIIGDTFSLNLIASSLHIKSLGLYGKAAIGLFIFLVFAQAPYCATCSTASSFYELRMPGYDGPQRAMLQIWASLRVFVVIALVTHIFFPWTLLKEVESTVGVEWWMQTFHFALFWLAVVIVRVVVVPVCRKIFDLLGARVPLRLSFGLTLFLIFAAMVLMYFETYFSSMEAF